MQDTSLIHFADTIEKFDEFLKIPPLSELTGDGANKQQKGLGEKDSALQKHLETLSKELLDKEKKSLSQTVIGIGSITLQEVYKCIGERSTPTESASDPKQFYARRDIPDLHCSLQRSEGLPLSAIDKISEQFCI